MSNPKFSKGDRVLHTTRPEWGIGAIVKVEELPVKDQPAQRLIVRFPNAGLKTLSTSHATLQLVPDGATGVGEDGDADTLAGWDKMTESDWLGEVAQRKVKKVMVSLNGVARDPFVGLETRLGACLDLYRFDRTGHSLIDWAVAQSGLDDPLSRFTRHELEVLFDQWAEHRAEHLQKLLAQARSDHQLVTRLVAAAPPAAKESVRRLTARG